MLAYLAAYHGIWGPHLIIVPTSVILKYVSDDLNPFLLCTTIVSSNPFISICALFPHIFIAGRPNSKDFAQRLKFYATTVQLSVEKS